MYLTEISPPELRGATGTVHALLNVLGLFVSQTLGLPQILGSRNGWPYLFAFSIIPAAIQIASLTFCPESPRHLYLNRNEIDRAKKAVEFFQGSENVTKEIISMEEEHLVVKDLPKVTFLDLFRDRFLRKLMIICIMLMLSQQFSGINAVMFYSTSIFVSAGLVGVNSLYATMGMGGFFFVATIFSMLIVERAGRRILMLAGLGGMLITTVLLVIFMSLEKAGHVWAQYLSVASVMLYIFAFAIGPGPIPWFIAGELFTQGPRAPAMSVVAGVNWSSALLISFLFPLVDSALNEYTFLVFTGFCVVFVIYTYFKVPETKGKRVEEIQVEMRVGI